MDKIFSKRSKTPTLSLSKRSENPDISEQKLREDITKLRGSIVELSKEYDDEYLRSYTFGKSRGIKFASRDLLFNIFYNIQILITYSEFLIKNFNITDNNLEEVLEIVLVNYTAQKNPIIDSFLEKIKEQLKSYTYFPHNVLESIVKFYLLKYFFEYLEESDEKNCVEITNILKYLIKITKTDLIEKKENLITPDEFSKFYSEGTTEIKGILLDFSYSIYTHTRYIKSLFTKLCIFKIVKICDLREKKSKSLINSSTGRSRNKVVPTSKGGGKINILIINLYSKPEKFDKKGEVFNEIFKNKAKLIIKNWEDKEGIIEIIKSKNINGIILSGSDFRIKEMNKGVIPEEVFKSNIPILGLCYGFQYLVYYYSSLKNIKTFSTNQYKTYDKSFKIDKPFKIRKTKYRFHHHDYISKLPKNWKIGVEYKKIIFMGFYNKHIGIQFHPEIHKQSAKLFYSMWLKFIRKYTS